ncbi:hypothetical protein BJV77DRAFT_1021401 [Russula vinacea]|nr:hypothetical protein BJV77DRAFT_1021401 [Russula vinacea]
MVKANERCPASFFRNPFRTPAATPNPTGASASSSVPPYASVASPLRVIPTHLPTTTSHQRLSLTYTKDFISPPIQSRRSEHRSFTTDDVIPEVAPPAYSVTPNVGGGELVVEQGRVDLSSAHPNHSCGSNSTNQQEEQGGNNNYNHLNPTSSIRTAPGPPDLPCAIDLKWCRIYSAPSSDGRPTTTPTPGHPLLRNGKTLVYPETYLCPKCTFLTPSSTCRYPRLSPQMRKGQNTGYKNYDPSHPCRKCWDRFSKPFTSILASSPWGSQGSGAMSQSERGRTFQRPLPAFKPPQVQPPRPMPGAYPQLSPPVMQSATVVMPGDPRIGGRLCWRCGGRGVTPFLIFDEITCDTCMGIGRLMN